MNNIFKKDTYYIIFGSLSMILSIILGLFNSDTFILNFLAGIFAGISIPLNICGIYKISRNLRKNKELSSYS